MDTMACRFTRWLGISISNIQIFHNLAFLITPGELHFVFPYMSDCSVAASWIRSNLVVCSKGRTYSISQTWKYVSFKVKFIGSSALSRYIGNSHTLNFENEKQIALRCPHYPGAITARICRTSAVTLPTVYSDRGNYYIQAYLSFIQHRSSELVCSPVCYFI